MAVAKELTQADPFFVQDCPLCGTSHRMMIRGLYVEGDKSMLYPDMGYSFCNCEDIFYTKFENVTRGNGGLNSVEKPVKELYNIFNKCESGQVIKITMRDPYFVIWTKPHDYTGFNPRVNHTLWDAENFVRLCKRVGFEIVKWERDMNVESETPECYHVTMRKP